MEPGASGGGWRRVALLVLSVAAIRLAVAALLPVMEAEAYYWLWSERLDWGYADHPPIVAVLIRAFGWIGGHGPLGVRLGTVLAATAGAFVFHAFARRVAGPRAAWASTVFVVVAPLWFPFGIVATPDGPLMLFWTASLYLFWRANEDGGWAWWLGAGLATGLAILSKYNGFQLPLVFLAFLLLTPRGRGVLRGPRPWAALALALLIASPNLAWNAAHGGRTLATPFDGGIDLADAAKNLVFFVVLPFAVLTPLIGYAWQRVTFDGVRAGLRGRNETFVFLCCASWIPFGLFAVVALVTTVGAHWVAPALLAAVPLALSPLDVPPDASASEPVRPTARFLRAGVWLAGLLMAAILLGALGLRQWAIGERGAADPASADSPDAERPRGLARAALELRGWDELRERLEREIAAHGDATSGAGPPPLIVSMNYHLVAKVQHLLGARVPGLPLKVRELHNYEVWHGRGESFVGRDAICIEKRERPSSLARLRDAFGSVTELPPVAVRLGDRTVHRFYLYRCRDFRRYPSDSRLVDQLPEEDAVEDPSGDE